MPTQDLILGVSCTCVGCGPGGGTPMIARVAIVNCQGQTVYDTYVQPTTQVSDHRTGTTGIEPGQLDGANGAKPFSEVQLHVARIIKGKVIVGHSLWLDLSVLGIPHPAVNTRDIALYQPFKNTLRGSANQVIGLQTLMWHLMRRRVQDGKIDALENARAALDLYRSHGTEWESAVSKGQWPCSLPPSQFSKCFT
ncbi:ribonuclease H-like domain-containing protein [Fomitopsis betulina]|nr:ribonuclease H-like domain-containing protein [Fomitopsis betulina]